MAPGQKATDQCHSSLSTSRLSHVLNMHTNRDAFYLL